MRNSMRGGEDEKKEGEKQETEEKELKKHKVQE